MGPTSVVHSYLKGLVLEGIALERQFIRRIAEVELNVLLLSALFRLVRNGAVRRVRFERMMAGCHGYGALAQISTAMIENLSGLDILRLARSMEVDPTLGLVAVARVAELDWAVVLDQEWFPYDNAQEILALRPR